MQVLIMMQGASGSGKSFVANALQLATGAEICSTDYYHFVDGVYKFQPEKLGFFHKRNFERCQALLREGKSVIVDNTNIEAAHAKPYIEFAKSLGVAVQVVRVSGRFGNVHGVPAEKVEQMRTRMQDLESLL